MVTLRTSATVERLDFLRQLVSRATAEEIFCFDLLAAAAAAAASRSAHSYKGGMRRAISATRLQRSELRPCSTGTLPASVVGHTGQLR